MAPSFARGKQTARQFKVLQILENSRFGMTTREIRDDVVDQLGLRSLHEKTIRRDIQHWCQLGYPIRQLETANPERPKVWKLEKGFLKTPKLPVGVVELLAFSAGKQLLYPLAGTPYWSGIQRLWERIRESTSPEVLEHLEQQRAALVIRGPAPKDYTRHEGKLSSLNRAVYEHRIAMVRYKSVGQPRARRRKIEPYAICLSGGNIYVLAGDVEQPGSAVKTFKLERMSSVELLDERFQPREDFDPQEYFDNSIGIFRSTKPVRFRIRLRRERSETALEILQHPKQRIVSATEDWVTVEIDAAYEEEIVPRVLSLGEDAEVLVPKSCRKRIAKTARHLARIYK